MIQRYTEVTQEHGDEKNTVIFLLGTIDDIIIY